MATAQNQLAGERSRVMNLRRFVMPERPLR
jgi:hypothetical protein